MTATKAGRRVVPIPLSKQPLIEGAGGGTMRATHWVHRGLPAAISALLPAGAPDEMRFLYGPAFRFDVCATVELAAIGVSTVVCADAGKVFVFPKGADYRRPEARVACDTVEGLAVVPGDWCHVTPTVALPHLRPRTRVHDAQHRRRPGRTSDVATTAIAARAGSSPRCRRPSAADAADPTDGASDRVAGHAADHTAVADPDHAPIAGPTAPDCAADRPGGAAPDQANGRVTDPEPDRAAADDGSSDGGDDGAGLAPRRSTRTIPGAGRAARAARSQLAAARQQRQLLDAASGDRDQAPTTVHPAPPQLTPIEYDEARMLLGNTSHRDTVTILRRAGRRPVNVDRSRARLDELRAQAGQTAQAMTHVPPTGLERAGGETVWADTMGGKLPRTKAGMQYCITWTFSSRPLQTYASFSASHDGSSTWAGFRQVCREAGVPVLEAAVSQNIELVTDQGTEFQGAFADNIDRAGILQSTSSAHKRKKHSAQRAELANRNLERFMRGGMAAARANFEASGHDVREYWDFCAGWACRALATRRRALASDTAGPPGDPQPPPPASGSNPDRDHQPPGAPDHPNAPLSWTQIVRRNVAPFGARGFVTIQEKAPERSRPGQLADRSRAGLFLGLTENGKSRMLLPAGEVYVTSDVTFPVGAMTPTSGPATFHDTEEWLAPFKCIAENDSPEFTSEFPEFSAQNPENLFARGPTGSAHVQPASAPAAPDRPAPAATAAAGPADIADPPDARTPDRDGLTRAQGTEPGCIATEGFSNSAIGDSVPVIDLRKGQRTSSTTTSLNSSPDRDPATIHHGTPTTVTALGSATGAPLVPAAGNAHADGVTLAAPDEVPAFTDSTTGAQIRIGDEVNVTQITGSIGSHRQTSRRGTVLDISERDEKYSVEYADGSTLWHPYAPGSRMPVLKRVLVGRSFDPATHRPRERHITTLMARRPAPSDAVRFAVGPDGNVKRGYWDGTLVLPPEPPLPSVRPQDAPVCPESVFQALAHAYAIHWLHAAVRERRGHLAPVNRPPTYHFTRQRPVGRRLMSKWVFTIKRHADGSIEKFKARECIAGWHLRRGTDYTESYSGMTPWSDVLDLESLAALLGLDIWEADLKQAYAFAPMPSTPSGAPVIAMSCPGAQVRDADGVLLHQQADQAWYGHPAAGFALAKHLHSALTGVNALAGVEVCPVPFVQNPFQPCMFQAKYPTDHPRHGELFILHVSTDNLRTYGSDPDIQADFMSWLRRQFEVTGGERSLRDQPPQKFMGCRFSYQQDGSVTIDMPLYIDELLNEVGMRDANSVATPMTKGFVVSLRDSPTTPDEQRAVVDYANSAFGTSYTQYADVISFYGHLVSSIGWITHRVGPIMQHAHSVLCRVLSAPSVEGFQGIKRLLRYLAGKTDMHRTYRPDRAYDWRNGDLPTWSIASDASYADDPHDRRGQGGYVGGYEGQAATTTTSKKTRRTCTAVDQAESDFAGSACKEAEYKRHWMGFFDILKPGPTTLTVDNFATFSRAGAPIRKWSPNSKQHDVNEKYVTECRERNVIQLEHSRGNLPEDPRPGEGFPPDAMTKALPRLPTEFYYDALHGRRTSPVGVRAVVDQRSLCTTLSDVHCHRSTFSGLVQVQYDDGTRHHVSPERIALYKG